MAEILQNAIRIEDEGKVTYLNSVNRHDFQQYTFSDGSVAFVDGGVSPDGYFRRGGRACQGDTSGQVSDWSLTKDSDFELIKQRLLWGTRGKSGKEELKYLPLAELETSHLEAIVGYNLEFPINPLHLSVIEAILEERKNALTNVCECCGQYVGLSKSVFSGQQILCQDCNK